MSAFRSDGAKHRLRRWVAGMAWLGCAALAVPDVAAQGLVTQAVAATQPMLVVEQGSHSAPVRRIDVSAARGLVVTASDDRTARLWDATSGELRHILRPLAFGAEGGRLYGAAFHPERPLVAVGGTTGGDGRAHRIYLFDTETGALQRVIDARAGDVRKLGWSRDGSLLLAGYGGTTGGQQGVRAFGLDGRLVFEDATEGPVFGLAVSSTGLLAAVSLSGRVAHLPRSRRSGVGAWQIRARPAACRRRRLQPGRAPAGRRLRRFKRGCQWPREPA